MSVRAAILQRSRVTRAAGSYRCIRLTFVGVLLVLGLHPMRTLGLSNGAARTPPMG